MKNGEIISYEVLGHIDPKLAKFITKNGRYDSNDIECIQKINYKRLLVKWKNKDKTEMYFCNNELKSIYSVRQALYTKDNLPIEKEYKEIGIIIKLKLLDIKQTQINLAEYLNIDKTYLNKYLNGEVAMPIHILRRISDFLDCSIDELLYNGSI